MRKRKGKRRDLSVGRGKKTKQNDGAKIASNVFKVGRGKETKRNGGETK